MQTRGTAGHDRAPRLTIRVATLDDLPSLHRIAERAVWSVLAGVHYTDRQLHAARALYRVEAELVAAGTYYALDLDGALVGGGGWSGGGFHPGGASSEGPASDAEAGTAVLRAGYVDPDWARQGLITLLVHTSEAMARLAGHHRFEAFCTPPSEALLRKLGYRFVERAEVAVADGVSMVGAVLRKELPLPATASSTARSA